MAWASTTSAFTSGTSEASGTTIVSGSVIWTAARAYTAIVATDNFATTEGNSNEHSSITDSLGNTWVKAYEWNNEGAAAGKATASVWHMKCTTGGTSTCTVNLANAVTAKAFQVQEWTIGASNVVSVEGTPVGVSADGADAGSLTVGSLTSAEYLFIRSDAIETATSAYTVTTNFSAIGGVSTAGGGDASNMSVYGEYRILTGTTSTSDPTTENSDQAAVFVALKEAAPPVVTGLGWAYGGLSGSGWF